jgi:hypothetical protein
MGVMSGLKENHSNDIEALWFGFNVVRERQREKK